MKETEFDKLFNTHIPCRKFDVHTTWTYSENIGNFQKLTFLKHNCKFLHKYLSNLFGDEYADKVITDILQNKLEISHPEKFTFDSFPYVEDCMCLNKFNEICTAKNFITVLTELEYIIINETRYGKSILFPDALLIISLYYSKFIKGKYANNMYFSGKRDLFIFVQATLKNFLKVLSKRIGDSEVSIMFGILDKPTFKKLTTENNYSFDYVDLRVRHKLIPKYKDYYNFIKMFLKCYQSLQYNKRYELPKLIGYVAPTESLNSKVIRQVADFLNVPVMRILSYFQKTYFTEITSVDSVEIVNVLEDCISKIKSNKTITELKDFITQTINEGLNPFTDRKDYTEIPVYKFMKKLKIKAPKPFIICNTYSNNQLFTSKRSEVIINYEKIYNELFTVDEELEELSKYYIDAQTINQARLSIFKGINYSDCRCHVKVRGIKQEFVPSVFIKLQEQTLFLRSAYNVNFTFEIEDIS